MKGKFWERHAFPEHLLQTSENICGTTKLYTSEKYSYACNKP
jgi:hypothetical protein